jgi:hypothetical protein
MCLYLGTFEKSSIPSDSSQAVFNSTGGLEIPQKNVECSKFYIPNFKQNGG